PYLIAFGGLLLLAGRLGDLIGRRRVLVAGLVLFTLASLLCGLSQSQGILIGARFIQGAAGALTSSVILGIIVTTFADARERARAIGVYSFVASAGASIGLLAGGVLTQAINWHWIFFVNIPIGIVAAMLAVRLLEDDPGIGLREGADVVGAVLVTSAPPAHAALAIWGPESPPSIAGPATSPSAMVAVSQPREIIDTGAHPTWG